MSRSALWLLPFTLTSLSAASEPSRLQALPACVEVRTQVRGSVGYDHLVIIANSCARAVSCQVSTDVNPQTIQARVAAGETHTVLTYRGSPAREFVAKVTCSSS